APGGEQGTVAALDKKTGKVLWRSKELKHAATYSSAVVATIGGGRQYVLMTYAGDTDGGFVVGVAAKDGKLLWSQHSIKGAAYSVSPTPVVRDNLVYTTVSSDTMKGCNLFEITPGGGGKVTAKALYPRTSQKKLPNEHGGVVLVGEHVYGCGDRLGWVCQDF